MSTHAATTPQCLRPVAVGVPLEAQRDQGPLTRDSATTSALRDLQLRARCETAQAHLSVDGATVTQPLTPCGGCRCGPPQRVARSAPVHIHEVDANPAVSGDRPDHGSQRLGGAPTTADDPTEIVGFTMTFSRVPRPRPDRSRRRRPRGCPRCPRPDARGPRPVA